jgi:hypothetical protein
MDHRFFLKSTPDRITPNDDPRYGSWCPMTVWRSMSARMARQFTRLLAETVPSGLVVAVDPSGYAGSVLRTALWFRGVTNAIVVATAL